jgi:hypothetical protein
MDEILSKMHANLSRKRPLPVKFEEENAQRITINRVSASSSSTSCCLNLVCLGGGKMVVTRDGDYMCNVCGACGPRVYINDPEWRVFAEDADKQSKIRASVDNSRSAIEANVFTAMAKAANMEERPLNLTKPFPHKANRPVPSILPKWQSTSPTPPSPRSRSPLVASNA